MSKSNLEESFLWQLKSAGITLPETEYRFHPDRRFRFDGAFVSLWLAYEIEGGIFMGKSGHNTGKGISRDCEKNNLAVSCGWKVYRFTKEMIEDGTALMMVENALKLGRGCEKINEVAKIERNQEKKDRNNKGKKPSMVR